MIRIPLSMHNRLERGEKLIMYCVVETHMGNRVYGQKELTCTISNALETSARVISFGAFERTIQPKTNDVLSSYSNKQQQHTTIDLDNSDGHFSRLIAKEPFIGRTITTYVGFEDEAVSTHIAPFTGVISELTVLNTLTIEADER